QFSYSALTLAEPGSLFEFPLTRSPELKTRNDTAGWYSESATISRIFHQPATPSGLSTCSHAKESHYEVPNIGNHFIIVFLARIPARRLLSRSAERENQKVTWKRS